MTEKADDNAPSLARERYSFSAEDRLYDFFKHVTTLSLLTLGGVLTIGEAADVPIDTVPFMLVIGLIAIGGVSAYSGMLEVVEAGLKNEQRPKRLAFHKTMATLGFGMGTGAFISVFFMSLAG